MFRTMAAGLMAAVGFAGAAWADGPMSVTTDFPTGVFVGDPFRDNLASIGVGVELAAPTFVDVFAGADLTFRLLESRPTRSVEITELFVDGVGYNVAPQAFSATGTLLGTHFLQGSFNDLVGFWDAVMEADPGVPPPLMWPEGFRVYIRTADEPNLTGIGPFIGGFDTLYFSIGSAALFSVSTSVPEPGTWTVMILGFGLGGAALRRARGRVALSAG